MTDLSLADLRVFKGMFHDHPVGLGEPVYHEASPQDLSSVLASLTDEQLAEIGGAVTILDSASVEGELVEVTMYLDRVVGAEMFRKGGNVLVVPIPEDS